MARKVKNFRDLGGIPAADGKSVCYGKLYRSGHLGKIKPEVAEKLRDRKGLRTVVDLRAPAELSHKRDIVPEGVDYLHLPPLTDEQNPAVTRHTGPSILKKIMKVEGGARTYLSDTYRTMISSEPSLRALREFFDVLLEDGGAVLWHCTQGKDRTGVVAAAILLALGVDRDEIMRDYMRTNRSCRFKNFWIFLALLLFAQIGLLYIAVSDIRIPDFIIKRILEKTESEGFYVSVGDVRLRNLTVITARDLSIGTSHGNDPFLRVRRCAVKLGPDALISGNPVPQLIYAAGTEYLCPSIISPTGKSERIFSEGTLILRKTEEKIM